MTHDKLNIEHSSATGHLDPAEEPEQTQANDQRAASRLSLALIGAQFGQSAVQASSDLELGHATSPRGEAGQAAKVKETAAEGIRGAGATLPHADKIQASFGPHDISNIKAHVAPAANVALGAEAFATGNSVATRDPSPSLRTVAHEAAHVVQQRAGVQLKDSIGRPGDHYERHADDVADRVVAGKPAADLLGPVSANTPAPSVQMLMSWATFKDSTHVKFGARKKIKDLDNALKAYHGIDPKTQPAQAKVALCSILKECTTYLAHADKSAKRKPGVRKLRDQARAVNHIPIYLDLANTTTDNLAKFKHLCKAQEMLIKAQAVDLNERDLAPYGNAILNALTQLRLATENKKDVDGIVAHDADALKELRDDLATPPLLRAILTELLANLDKTALATGAAGATESKKDGPFSDKKYTVTHKPDVGSGKTERLGSLAHELTHVSVGEKIGNSSLFLTFAENATEQEVDELCAKRDRGMKDLQALQTELDLPKLAGLKVREKIDYALGTKLRGYADRFHKAGKISTTKHGQLLALANKRRLADQADNLIIEYDSVINQLLVYMHLWTVPENNAFHAKVRELAQDAYDFRSRGGRN